MHLLSFTVDSEAFAIESRRVVEVVPRVPARPIPRMPEYVTGVFGHRGKLVPMIDLGRILCGTAEHRPLDDRLSTRVIVVDVDAVDAAGRPASIRLGLAAEQVFSLFSSAAAASAVAAAGPPGPASLGPLLRIDGRVMQLLIVERLLPRDVLAELAASCPPPPRTSKAS